MKRVAVGIVLRNGLVLGCQRLKTGKFPLKWEFPGGKLEPGEGALDALVRELREELAIEVTGASEFHTQKWIYGGENGSAASQNAFHVTYFLVTGFRGEPANLAFEQIQWVTPDTLASLDILDGNREAVQLLLRHAETPNIPR